MNITEIESKQTLKKDVIKLAIIIAVPIGAYFFSFLRYLSWGGGIHDYNAKFYILFITIIQVLMGRIILKRNPDKVRYVMWLLMLGMMIIGFGIGLFAHLPGV